MNIREASAWLKDALPGAGSAEPDAEARWMLEALAGRKALLANERMPDESIRLLRDWVAQRASGRPLQYILGEWDFYGLTFKLREGALIPRPETELLVERALERAKRRGYRTALDVGTGSGCIAVTLAKLGGLVVTATDVSFEALALARENARSNGVDIEFLHGSYFAPVMGSSFDLIVSNPPYIERGDLESLQRELRFEPAIALDGGEDGKGAYRELCAGVSERLNPGGSVFFECGCGQPRAVAAMLEANGFQTEIFLDNAGLERIVAGYD